ncbi:response regulator [Janthinobacterium sp.]|uniref:response regulator n=1 Tax=Janthinobacterium sp. TaxID=1871054 RepID=UPI00293D31E6|nr:response regulator [Janthinobacterium sp.]
MPAISFLIADPSPAVQTFVRQQLESYDFDGATIKTVATPQAACEVAADIKPDFLLTDTFAKEAMSGVGLHRAVQKHSAACHFAMVGAAVTESDQKEAREAGAYFLLAKPFTAEVFRGALATALAQLAQTHPQIAQQVMAQTRAATPAPKVVLPALPQYKPGDPVSYKSRRETVKHVILRRGELVVQLHGEAGLVEASQLQPL